MTTLNISMSKFLDLFKNLKSDAVPRAPRPAEDQRNETPENQSDDPPRVHIEVEDNDEEEIVIEPEEDIKKKPKPKKKFFKSKKHFDDEEEIKPTKEKRDSTSSVNVQATGNVYNIVNSSKVRLGNDYYFGPVSPSPSKSKSGKEKDYDEDIEKDNFISLLMEAEIKPDHDYMSYVSKNLGKNWHSFFRVLGFTQGRIESAEIDAQGYGISEARYKLLVDWVNNDEDGTLGRLATLLWEEGERSIVKELSLMYKKSKSRK